MLSLLEGISKVVFVEEALVLLLSDVSAVLEISQVGSAEVRAVAELGDVFLAVLLHSFNNVAVALSLEDVLSEDDIDVTNGSAVVVEVSLDCFLADGVSEGALVVGNGPFGGGHDAEVVVAVGVEAADEGVLGGEGPGVLTCE